MDLLEIINKVFTVSLAYATVRICISIVFAGMGEMITERSGVFNMGVEGIMLMGAFSAAIGTHFSGSPWIGLLTAAVVGMLIGLLFAFIAISIKSDQAISGLAIYLLCVGLSGYLLQVLFKHGGNSPKVETLPIMHFTFLENIPIINDIFNNPKALAVVGKNPIIVRYIAVLAGSLLAGIGGAYLSISQTSIFSERMVNGRGFIALSAVIFGNVKPFGVFAACMFFGFMDALQYSLQTVIPDQYFPREVFMALPYILTLMILAGFIKRSSGPADIGKPYEKESR
jgi:simple sugar transport system permease protein